MRSKNTATFSTKFRIFIPEAVRSARNWKAGQEFAFIPKGNGVLLIPVPTFEELAGCMAGANIEDYRDRSDRY